MWIGSIRIAVHTGSRGDAGTDSLVTASILRSGKELSYLKLDYPTENDLERYAMRNYDYIGPTKLPRKNDKTPPLPDGLGQIPMPYPGYGLEYSDGLGGHLSIRLRIHGSDLWVKDNIDLYIRQIRQTPTSFDTFDWQEDNYWTYVATWSRDTVLSTDSSEGVTTLNLTLN